MCSFGGLFFFVYLWRSKNNLEHDYKPAENPNPAEEPKKGTKNNLPTQGH
jgi:hypothetical protein